MFVMHRVFSGLVFVGAGAKSLHGGYGGDEQGRGPGGKDTRWERAFLPLDQKTIHYDHRDSMWIRPVSVSDSDVMGWG